MPRMELADVIFILGPDSSRDKTVKAGSDHPFSGQYHDMTLADVYHNFAARVNPTADPEPARRRRVVQAEFAYQCISEGQWGQQDDMDEWEILFVHLNLSLCAADGSGSTIPCRYLCSLTYLLQR